MSQRVGYSAEQVTLYADEGTAAAKPLLDRPGYTALLQAISKGDVTILLVSDISRLFTDATEVQLNTLYAYSQPANHTPTWCFAVYSYVTTSRDRMHL